SRKSVSSFWTSYPTTSASISTPSTRATVCRAKLLRQPQRQPMAIDYMSPYTFGFRISAAIVASLALITSGVAPAASPPPQPPPAAAHQFVIGISPFLDKTVKDDVFRGIVGLMVQDLRLDSSLTIYDAFELKSITRLSVPDLQAFNSPKTRA